MIVSICHCDSQGAKESTVIIIYVAVTVIFAAQQIGKFSLLNGFMFKIPTIATVAMVVLATGEVIQQVRLLLFVVLMHNEPRQVHHIIVYVTDTVIFATQQSGKFHFSNDSYLNTNQ